MYSQPMARTSIVTKRDLRLFHREGTNDKSIAHQVIHKDVYRLAEAGLRAGDLVLDVGGHIGAFGLAASALFGCQAVIVEPIPENVALQACHFALNDHPLAPVLWCRAIGRVDGEALTVKIPMDDLPHRFVGETAPVWVSGHYVTHTITLGSALRDFPSREVQILKMDCEGAEWDVVANAPRATLTRMRRIAAEVHGRGGVAEFVSLLEGDFVEDPKWPRALWEHPHAYMVRKDLA